MDMDLLFDEENKFFIDSILSKSTKWMEKDDLKKKELSPLLNLKDLNLLNASGFNYLFVII